MKAVNKKMTESDKDIINNCRKGDRKAQLKLYTTHSRRVYNSCYRILRNQYDAEDAMQESFLKALSNLQAYDDNVSFEAWITRIAINTSIDKLRQKSLPTDELNENIGYNNIIDDDDSEEWEYTLEKVDLIKRAIDSLPDPGRLILTLYLIEGYDHDEIADILSTKPGTIRVQYMRAKQKIVDLLKLKTC